MRDVGRGSPEPARWTPARCPSTFAYVRPVPSSALSSAPSHDRSSADSPIRTAATRQARHPTRPHRCSGFGHPGTDGPTAAYQAGALNPIPVPSRLTSLARFLTLLSWPRPRYRVEWPLRSVKKRRLSLWKIAMPNARFVATY